MNKKKITSKKLRSLVKELNMVLNLMSVMNLIFLMLLGIFLVKTKFYARGTVRFGISAGVGAVLLWFTLKSQFKKLTYKKNLGKNLDQEQWELLNTEIERPSARQYGDINQMANIILTRSFILFPTNKGLETIALDQIESLEKITRQEKNKKEESTMEILTSSKDRYNLGFHEELYNRLRHQLK